MNHPHLPERRTDDVIRWRYRTAIQAARMLNATKGEGGETSERPGFPRRARRPRCGVDVALRGPRSAAPSARPRSAVAVAYGILALRVPQLPFELCIGATEVELDDGCSPPPP